MARDDEIDDDEEFAFPPQPLHIVQEPPHFRIRREMPTRADYERACQDMGIEPWSDEEIMKARYSLTEGYPTEADRRNAIHVDRLILLIFDKPQRNADG